MPNSQSALKKPVDEMSVGMLVKELTELSPRQWEDKGDRAHVQFYGYYEELPWDDFMTCAECAFRNHLLAAVCYHVELLAMELRASEKEGKWFWNSSWFGEDGRYCFSIRYEGEDYRNRFWNEFGDEPAEAALRALVAMLRDTA